MLNIPILIAVLGIVLSFILLISIGEYLIRKEEKEYNLKIEQIKDCIEIAKNELNKN